MTTKTIQYDGRSAALKQVLELFTTLGGRIIDKDESPYDQEFVKKFEWEKKARNAKLT